MEDQQRQLEQDIQYDQMKEAMYERVDENFEQLEEYRNRRSSYAQLGAIREKKESDKLGELIELTRKNRALGLI